MCKHYEWKSLPQLLHKSYLSSSSMGHLGSREHPPLNSLAYPQGTLSCSEYMTSCLYTLGFILLHFCGLIFLTRLVPQLFVKPTFINYFHMPGLLLGLKKTKVSSQSSRSFGEFIFCFPHWNVCSDKDRGLVFLVAAPFTALRILPGPKYIIAK